MKSNEKGFSISELMVVCAIIGILSAVALPFYVAYKRTACDRTAQADLSALLPAWEKYLQDEGNVSGTPPNSLEELAGKYYGWPGTNQACGVRVFYDKSTLTVYAAALHGSRPRGRDTRYAYRLRLPSSTMAVATSTTPSGE